MPHGSLYALYRPFWKTKSTFRRSFGNWFDFVLILAGLADIYIIAPMATGGSAARNITMLRLFRATKPLGLGAHGVKSRLRSLRSMRMVRTFRLFHGLRLLVKAQRINMYVKMIQNV